MTDQEILKKALDGGIIDIATIRLNLEMQERSNYLENHPYKIWQGSDGKWRVYLYDRKMVKRATKEAVEDAIVEYYKSQEYKPYIKDMFEEWLESKVRYGEITKATIDRYRADYNKYISNSVLESKPLYLIENYELEDYVKAIIPEMEMTTKSYGNLKTLLTGIFKFAKSKKQTDISISQFFGDLQISKKVFKQVIKKDEEQVFTDEEFEALEEYIINAELSYVNLAILFGFYTGLRSGEIAGLKKEDVHNDYIEIKRTEIHYKNDEGKEVYELREMPKTINGYRRIILPDAARKIIHMMFIYFPKGDRVFYNDNSEPIHAYVCTHKLYRLCDAINIKRRSMHKCRKTYATKLINGKVDKRLIMKMMGHSDIATTEKYYYFDNSTSENAKSQIINAVTYS